ncbi:MAG: hypothetical protein R3A52_26630 [Polyangiales bacterium]
MRKAFWCVCPWIALAACGPSSSTPSDAGSDVATVDAPATDAVTVDRPASDTGVMDTGSIDTGAVDTGPTDTGPTDTGPTDTGALDAGELDAGPQCNVLSLGAPPAPSIAASGSPPAFTGGTVPEGMWHLSRRTFFGGPADPVPRRETMLFGGGAFDFNSVVEVGGGAPLRSRGSYTAAGTTFTTNFMCPTASSESFPYRVMPDGTLLLQRGAEVRTFARHCGTATLGGPVVTQTAGAGPAPAPTGGTIANGTYHLTAVVKHGGGALGTSTRQQTNVFMDGSFQAVVWDSQGGFAMYQGSYSTTGTTLNVNTACPAVGAAPATSYTATATTVIQYANPNEYLVFTRM